MRGFRILVIGSKSSLEVTLNENLSNKRYSGVISLLSIRNLKSEKEKGKKGGCLVGCQGLLLFGKLHLQS